MIPYELKPDKDGLLYLECDNLNLKHLLIDKRKGIDEYYQSGFCSIPSSDEYIVKYSCTYYTRKQIKAVKEMLRILVDKQKDISSVDFPIGYATNFKKLIGLIIKYYNNGISWDNVIKTGDIEYIGKFYYHDEDNVHNIFLLFNELLNIIIELFDNNILYTDINPGNIVLSNNQVKLIDFDYRYVLFNNKDTLYKTIIDNYLRFIMATLEKFNLYNLRVNYLTNFNETKTYIKKLENSVHRSRV